MIKVIHKVLNILEYLARHEEGVTLSAIAAHIEERTTTTSNIVKDLSDRGYLERVNGKWKLGIGAYMLTGSARDYDRVLCAVAEPILHRLAEKTQAQAVLSVWRGQERYVLLRASDASAVTVNRDYPETKQVYSTATGMILLAEQSPEVIDAYIAENGIPGIAEPSDTAIASFRAVLEQNRRRGCYLREKGDIFEAAVAVHDETGSLCAAIGIFLPLFRAGNKEALIRALREAAAELQSGIAVRKKI
ncbi:MAG: helix-turn-helix domain-containing protein [Clostridia bacterium]|nr:helix-turn-helix domain-containing protein [Clostridia bacterium]